MYTVCSVKRDPHRVYRSGDVLTRERVVTLAREARPESNGLEFSDGGGYFRIYLGRIYELRNGQMVLSDRWDRAVRLS